MKNWNDIQSKKTYAIWKDQKVVGYCEMDEKTAHSLNGNGVLYFGFDKVIAPENYEVNANA